MKLIKKAQVRCHQNSDKCTAWEYPLDDPDINIAFIEINGRYPDRGWIKNNKCKELAYVVEGSGNICVEDDEREISEGDLILILPGEKFYWEGSLKMIVPCTPAWSPDQYEYVD